MTKEKDKKKPPAKSFSKLSNTTKACVYLLLSFCFALSLWSFHYDQVSSQNWIGLVGWAFSSVLMYGLGLSAFFAPVFFLALFFLTLRNAPSARIKKVSFAFGGLFISLSLLLSMLSPYPSAKIPEFFTAKLPELLFKHRGSVVYLGGFPFYAIYHDHTFGLKRLLGVVGTALFSSILGAISIFYLTGLSKFPKLFKKKNGLKLVKNCCLWLWKVIKNLFKQLNNTQKYLPQPTLIRSIFTPEVKKNSVALRGEPTPPTLVESFPKPSPRISPSRSSSCQLIQLPPPPKTSAEQDLSRLIENKRSELPQYHLLSKREEKKPESLKEELQKKAYRLKNTLDSFGIEAEIGNISFGPTLAAFEVYPSKGVKVQKIKTLEHDLALNLEASSIRIIAPIPGKAAVGIEIPNPYPQPVNFRDILEAYQKQKQKLQVPLLLGKKANGDYFWLDLATMPHLIIAGTTGSGKSVCINTLVMSLIMTSLPSELKLVLVDPKKVELTGYSRLPHMLTPVITESKDAHNVLMWLVKEMELRYEILGFLGLRNIQTFNSRKRDLAAEAAYDREIPEKMYFIVGIIDELSDLLLSSSQDIETPIVRLAQKARAVGIHLILATQRPSRDVITGLIKANFPARIAFKVANKVNSQIIIDEPGAEILMGNGDMLVISSASFEATRAQGAYICDDDINKVVDDICSRFHTKYVIASFDAYEASVSDDDTHKDPLFNQAKDLILQTGTASTTFLQRKLKIGYARAASLMDQLEQARVIGPSEGSKPRQVLLQNSSQEH